MDDETWWAELTEERVEPRRRNPVARPCPDPPRTTLTEIPFTAADADDAVAVRTETSGDVSSEKTFRAKDPHRFAKIGTTSAGSQRPLRIQRHRSSRMRSAGPRLPCRAIFGSAPDAVGWHTSSKRAFCNFNHLSIPYLDEFQGA